MLSVGLALQALPSVAELGLTSEGLQVGPPAVQRRVQDHAPAVLFRAGAPTISTRCAREAASATQQLLTQPSRAQTDKADHQLLIVSTADVAKVHQLRLGSAAAPPHSSRAHPACVRSRARRRQSRS